MWSLGKKCYLTEQLVRRLTDAEKEYKIYKDSTFMFYDNKMQQISPELLVEINSEQTKPKMKKEQTEEEK